MNYFILDPHLRNNQWYLHCYGRFEDIQKKLDPEIRAKISKDSATTFRVDISHSQKVLAHLALKSSLYLSDKPVHADLFNKACLEHLLTLSTSLDAATHSNTSQDVATTHPSWIIRTQVRVAKTHFFLDQALCSASSRWLIHAHFFYLIDDSVDKRAIIEGQKIQYVSAKQAEQWTKQPDSYDGYCPLLIDSQAIKTQAVEDEAGKARSINMQMVTRPLCLKLRDYGLTEIELYDDFSRHSIDDPQEDALSLFEDLIELGATWWPTKKCFKWQHPELASEALVLLQEIGWSIQGPKNEPILTLKHIHLKMSESAPELLEAEGEASFEDLASSKILSLSIGALASHLKKGLKLAPLPDGALALMPAKWQPMLSKIKKAHPHQGRLRWKPWQISQALQLELSSSPLESWKELNLSKFQEWAELKNPSSITFRPYQRLGINWLLKLWQLKIGGLLADDMGLGKTIQILGFLHQLDSHALDLIIVPLSLLSQWKMQAQNFLKSSIIVYHGPKRSCDQLTSFQGLVLTTYQTLAQDIKLLASLPWRTAIFDESHLLRNPKSQLYQAAELVKATLKIGMSGTPIFNSLEDFWAQMRLLAPSIIQNEPLPSHAQEPLESLSPLWLKRTKEEVAPELPEKVEQLVWLDMEDEQLRLYNQVLQAQLKNTTAAEPSPLEILEKILRLRQCCLHPNIVDSGFTQPGIKQLQLLNDLGQIIASGQKVIVFSQFAQVLKAMFEATCEQGLSCFYLDSTSRNREKILDSFTQQASACALFMTLGSGGVGLNLTCASYVILLDPWWNESAENQAIDRAHRIGQQKTVFVIRYLIKQTLEEAMQEIKEEKKSHIQTWLSSGSTPHPDEDEQTTPNDRALFSHLKSLLTNTL